MTTLPPESNDGQGAAQNPEGAAPAQPTTPQPEATVPPAAPQYEAPPAGAYQQPQAGYQQPAYTSQSDPVSMITLNYWLSVFFTWIPALIFWVIEKDKGNQRATGFHVANLNFSLVRTILGFAIWILSMIPYVGWILALLLSIAGLVLFVFHIIAAVKAPEAYRRGGQPEFIFNIAMVK